MQPLEPQALASTIVEFLRVGNNAALFAGAGVGVRAGLPGWAQLLDQLATATEKYDTDEAAIIRKRANAGHYLSAAQAYKSCPSIPESEKFRLLSAPFENPPFPEKLKPLISLPFAAVFTTNYDRSLHHAYAAVMHKDAKRIELDDPTMGTAPFERDFHIARLHGRAEVPASIVLAEADYDRLDTPAYVDMIRTCFTRYRCLIVGFSFLDPAIEKILNLMEQQLGVTLPQLHLAVLPADTTPELRQRLGKFNIQLCAYDPGLDHGPLWDAILRASREFTNTEKYERSPITRPLNATKRFVSAAYARTKMATELIPLRDVVTDGIILDILNRTRAAWPRDALVQELHKIIGLPQTECLEIVRERIRHMAGLGLCGLQDEVVTITTNLPDDLSIGMRLLVDGAVNRLLVRYGIEIDKSVRAAVRTSIESTLIARGWDLGRAYMGTDSLEEMDTLATVRGFLDENLQSYFPETRQAIALACHDLFVHPNEEEGKILARLGRVAFALHLVFNAPSTTYTHSVLLPQRVYLDSNVLMRATVDGHPLEPVYADTMRRLQAATHGAGLSVSVAVLPGFLDEVIAHRELAINEVTTLKLEDPNTLQNHLRYYGAERANIFVAAYATWVSRLKKAVKFREFLNNAAPYNSRATLASRLRSQGIDVFTSQSTKEARQLFADVHSALHQAYEGDPRSKVFPKEAVLIEHEARQLTQLCLDHDSGTRALFVSGDIRLQRFCEGPLLSRPRAMIISGRQFVQLMDLLLGLQADPVATARLLWGTAPIPEDQLILNYLTDLALQHYDAAQAKSLSQVLPHLVPKIIKAAKDTGIQLSPGGNLQGKARRAKFLDRFEDEFYELMAQEIRRQKQN